MTPDAPAARHGSARSAPYIRTHTPATPRPRNGSQTLSAAHCQRCDWDDSGDPAAVDRAAEKHTKTTGHPTATVTAPCLSSECDC